MSDFLKKLKTDLETGTKTEFVEKFKSIVEQADSVNIAAVEKKIEEIDFEALGLLGTKESIEESDEKNKNFLKAEKIKDEKKLAQAKILQLEIDNNVLRLAIEENNLTITELSTKYFDQYGESYK